MAFVSAPAQTSDLSVNGPQNAKAFPTNTHNVILDTTFVGAPAPFSLQTPPKTTGRPF